MDYSKFYLNWGRLWVWVVTPLLIRLAATYAYAFYVRPVSEKLAETRAYSQAVATLEKTAEKQVALIAPFIPKNDVPFQEYFLTQVSQNSKRADVKVSTDSQIEGVKGTKLERARFTVSGNADSLHEISVFLDYMMQEQSTVVTHLNVDAEVRDAVRAKSVNFKAVFERVDLKKKTGKVSA